MKATQFFIEDRLYQKPSHIPVASIDDFSYQEGAVINAEVITDDPNISLYCLDDEHRQAIFVVLPSDISLSKAPFYYQAQFDNAQSLIALPYQELYELAAKVKLTLAEPILIYSTGRCGSTLLHHIFNESGEVVSFSEPDVFTQMIHLQARNSLQDLEIISLIQDCTRLIFKPISGLRAYHHAIKFRNQCIALMELFHQAFPKAKNLFLYRNALDYVASEYRLLNRHRISNLVPVNDALAWLERYHGTIALGKLGICLKTDTLSWFECFALNWLIIMDRALAYSAQNIPMLPVRYEDLNSNRLKTVTQLFEYCNLPCTRVMEGLKAFERDSQQGTVLARDSSNCGNTTLFDETQKSKIAAIIAQHPVIQSPNFIMPGTLRL